MILKPTYDQKSETFFFYPTSSFQNEYLPLKREFLSDVPANSLYLHVSVKLVRNLINYIFFSHWIFKV